MRGILETVAVAFSMFSALPMPQISWEKRNMRYALCAFPLVGGVIGGLCWLWGELCQWGGVPDLLRGAVLCLLPAAVTGGIHLDGYCDTVDALASHGTPARRQEILKDPHIGAFGVIRLCGYFLLSFALWTTLTAPVGKELCLSFCLSRCLSGGEIPAGKAFGPGLYLCHRRRPEAGGLDFAAGRRGSGGNRMLEEFGRRGHGAGGTAGILGLLAQVQEILWRAVRGFGRLVFAAGGALDAGGRMDCGMGGASSVIFVTGPLFAGKREYICKALGWSEEDLARRGIWEVQNLAGQEEDLEKLAKNLAQYEVVIATEVGGGVVPVDPVQRQNREAAGRLACLLAQRADRVIRVFCGLPQALKGELP